MIHISDIAKRIKSFLEKKGEDKIRIFVRVNSSIDVYIATSNEREAHEYQEEFYASLVQDSNNDTELDEFYSCHIRDLKIKFYTVNSNDVSYDPYYENMFSNKDDVIDWGPRYRFESFLGPKVSNEGKRKTPIVTFYSYKGGMGRTTTMIAYAMSLAAHKDVKKRKSVVIIDCDLEAPGYLNFFDLSKHNGLQSGKKNGLVEFFSDAQFSEKPEELKINDYIVNVGHDNENNFAFNNLDNIWLVPAGNLNEGYADLGNVADQNDYLEGLAKLNLANIQTVLKYFKILLNKIEELEPDIILLDSRTGFNDIFGTAALYLSTCVVGFFGFNRQTEPGLVNLLKSYYRPYNNFNLQLVFSILPENASEEWTETHKRQISSNFINYIGNESKDYPLFNYLHRNNLLEKIGTGDDRSDSEFVEIVCEQKFEDYSVLFNRINEQLFPNVDKKYSKNMPALQLRNVVLKHLKNALTSVSMFAEETNIIEDQFFYRKCMKEFFDSKKFIIRGYKGTGKTYLYKALTDRVISENIQKWSGIDTQDVLEPLFVNILPPIEEDLVFSNIRYSKIDEPEYYFKVFWQIYTWNAILLQPEFADIKEESELSDYVKELSGQEYATKALIRIEELIDKGASVLITIGNDMVKINEHLNNNRKRLFVLYDRLDTCINPLRWNKAVSPLINYWWNNCEAFSNITPKIFVRTDLFNQTIEGTNTVRLENRIINIEWSIGEVFGFFFKLIFSNKEASDAYWAIAEKIGIESQYIDDIKNTFSQFPKNQFKELTQKEMKIIVEVFFGRIVKVGNVKLGSPWEYFEKELANADKSAISLRPFITTMSSNAVDKALTVTDRYVEALISPEIYASKAVREQTTEKYFDDLTRDPFSTDLKMFKEVIRSSTGEKFRYKSLTESQYEELISLIFERIDGSEVVKSEGDLKRLIEANGIMARKVTRKGKIYQFAPIYWYSWGMKNLPEEKEGNRKMFSNTSSISLVDGVTYNGVIRELPDKKGVMHKRVLCDIGGNLPPLIIKDPNTKYFRDGDSISFVASYMKNEKNNSDFWYATHLSKK